MNSFIMQFVLVVLILLASLSGFFGKNLPGYVWWLSIISAGLLGFVISGLLAPFPDNLLLGTCTSTGLVVLVLILRIPRRNQPR